MRILLVEDDTYDAQLVELLLARDKEVPHDIEWVETITEGIDKMSHSSFDVALIDLNLPDASNGDAVHQLSATHTDVPIVVLSGNDDEDLAVSLIESGAQDYLLKGDVGTASLNRAMRYAVERKATEVSLRERASVDVLTGLSNRLELTRQLDRAMSQANRSGSMAAVLMIDLDHFKSVNDTYGHAAGDTLLKIFGERLAQSLRLGDTAARIGGDEFAILLEGIESENDARNWLIRALPELRKPILFDNVALPFSMSVGTALYPTHGADIERIMRCADVAMYAVKKKGRNGFCIYNESMEKTLRQRDRIEQEIRKALKAGHFVPHFQPQINLNDGDVCGLEAVCRWLRTDKVYAMPSEYIPLVQNYELIGDLGLQIFTQVCEQLDDWQSLAGTGTLPVSIKVDSQELLAPEYAKRLAQVAQRYGIEPGRLRLEMRSGTYVDGDAAIQANFTELVDAGFAFSIDRLDLDLIAKLPIPNTHLATLKLNRKQTAAVFGDRMAIPVTRALVHMAAELDVAVVGEGVETARHFRALQQLGCEQAQGYFIARPMNAANLTVWLRRHDDRQQQRGLSMTGKFKLPPPLRRFQPNKRRRAATKVRGELSAVSKHADQRHN